MKLCQLTFYGFFLHTCHLSDRVRKGINPSTGEPVEFPIDDGLTDVERNAVRRVFAKFGVEGPEPEFEGYALYIPGNGSVRFRGGEFEDDEMPIKGLDVEISVKKLSDDILRLVFEVARQGNLAFMSSIGDQVGLPSKSSGARSKKRWPEATIIESTDSLRSWLENQIGSRKVQGFLP